jgi:hypothetical protein
MRQRFTILFKPGQYWQRHLSCVYKITIGHKFYIGKTELLNRRRGQHENGINEAINDYPNRHPCTMSAHHKIAIFLLENPQIDVGYIEMIQCADNSKLLDYAEAELIFNSLGNSDCLNAGIYKPCISRSPKKSLIKIRIYEYYRWFYNPATDQEVIEWDEVNVKGALVSRDNPKGVALRFRLIQQISDKYGILS